VKVVLLRSACLTISALLARSQVRDKWLRTYFAVQVVQDIVCFAVQFRGRQYPAIFSTTEFLILAVSAVYVFQHFRLESFHNKFYAVVECLVLPTFIVAMTFHALKPFFANTSIKITLADSAALFSLGVGLLVTMYDDITAKILAVLWLSLAGWHFAYAYGLPLARPIFIWLNQSIPAILVIVAFVTIFFKNLTINYLTGPDSNYPSP
jgi:hypothetical protein